MHCLSDFIPWNQVSVTGDFVGHIQELIRTEVLPYQWEALNDQIAGAEPSHCLDNFRAAAEKKAISSFMDSRFRTAIFTSGLRPQPIPLPGILTRTSKQKPIRLSS